MENKGPNPGFWKAYLVKQRFGEEKNRSLAASHNHVHWLCGNRCFLLASAGACWNTDTPALLVAGICNCVLCQEELCLIHDCAHLLWFPLNTSALTLQLHGSCWLEQCLLHRMAELVGWQRPQRPSSPSINPAVLGDECHAWRGSFNDHKRRNKYT